MVLDPPPGGWFVAFELDKHDVGLPDLGGYNALKLVFRRWVMRGVPLQVVFTYGEEDMGDKGKKDKGKREHQKTAQRTPEEKRRLKKEKKEERKNR